MLSGQAKDTVNSTEQLEFSPSSYVGPGDWQMEPSKAWRIGHLELQFEKTFDGPCGVTQWELLQGMESGNGFESEEGDKRLHGIEHVWEH